MRKEKAQVTYLHYHDLPFTVTIRLPTVFDITIELPVSSLIL